MLFSVPTGYTVSLPDNVYEKPAEWTFETMVPYLADKYDQDEDLARRIIECESGSNKSARNDNYTKEGIYWSSDWGYWQINDYWHVAEAQKKGYDIVNVWQENLEWGFKLLARDGADRHWSASKYCWGKGI